MNAPLQAVGLILFCALRSGRIAALSLTLVELLQPAFELLPAVFQSLGGEGPAVQTQGDDQLRIRPLAAQTDLYRLTPGADVALPECPQQQFGRWPGQRVTAVNHYILIEHIDREMIA